MPRGRRSCERPGIVENQNEALGRLMNDPEIPRKVVFHVGMTKAGSTVLQNFMDARREELLEKGFLFPRSVFTRKDPYDPLRTSGHLELLRLLSKGSRTAFEREIRKTVAGCHTLVLSAETVMMKPRPPGLDRLRSLLRNADIHLVALVREQSGWLSSFYYEAVTKGWHRDTRSFDRFCSDVIEDDTLLYSRTLSDICTILGTRSLRVLHYDRLLSQGNLITEFLNLIGCDIQPTDEDIARRDNRSQIWPDAVEAHRRLNTLIRAVPSSISLELSHILRNEAARMARDGALAAGPLTPSAPVRRTIMDQIGPSNAQLSRDHLNGQAFGPDPAWPDMHRQAPDESAIGMLFEYGLKCLADLEMDKNGTRLPWKPREARFILRCCAAARVILCHGADRAMLVAAGLGGRLIFVLTDGRDEAVQLQHDADLAALQSEMIVRPLRTGADVPDAVPPRSDDIAAIWSEPFFRHPDAILIDGLLMADGFTVICDRIDRPVTVLFAQFALCPYAHLIERRVRVHYAAAETAEFILNPEVARDIAVILRNVDVPVPNGGY